MSFLLAGLLALIASAQTIVMLGDSLTEGYGVAQKEAFPALVERELQKKHPKVKVINAGIGGSTSASGLSRIKWVSKSKPDIIFICLGANDGLRGIKVEETKKNIDAMLAYAKENRLKIVLAGMQMPPNYGEKYRKDFARIFDELAKKYGVSYLPFLLEGVGGKPELNQADGIHPNEKGHKIIAETVLRKLSPLVRNL